MDNDIYGSAWYSQSQKSLRASLTIGYVEYILSAQEWREIASIAQQMMELHERILSPEEIEQLRRGVITLYPAKK